VNIRDNPRIVQLKTRLAAVRAELYAAMAEEARLEVENYEVRTPTGPTTLKAMFDGGRDLFVIHNMGVTCPNCTLWADGFNGFYPHIATRAAFFVASPDAPETQAAFAARRGWKFPMISHARTTFAVDMGFVDDDGRPLPGISAFQTQGGKIVRVSANVIQPGDLTGSTIWHLLAMLPEGADGWKPRIDGPAIPAVTEGKLVLPG
jgi:predicted dithiol-disulfide oxidoreductase (DUF899 family)